MRRPPRIGARGLLLLFVCSCLEVAAPRGACASSLMVTPVTLELGVKASSRLLTVTNRGDGAVRLEVTVLAWALDAEGRAQLAPTEDLMVFPMLFSLAPGSSRILRVELAGRAEPRAEKAYRVLIEELAPPRAQANVGAVTITMNLSIPVFVPPSHPRGEVALGSAAVEGGHLRFSLTNAGNAHVRLRTVTATAESPPGTVHELPAWYLLAGGARDFDVALDAAECAGASAFLLEVGWDGGTLSRRLPVPAHACR